VRDLGETKPEQLGETNNPAESVVILPENVGGGSDVRLGGDRAGTEVRLGAERERLGPERAGPDVRLGAGKIQDIPVGPQELGYGGTADIRLAARAAKERWPIPASVRENVAKWMADVAENARDRRARVNAVKVLAELDKLNMEQEKVERGGDVQRVDITSGGKPLVPDAKALSDAELAERIKALEG
jgi:hypothetical protein